MNNNSYSGLWGGLNVAISLNWFTTYILLVHACQHFSSFLWNKTTMTSPSVIPPTKLWLLNCFYNCRNSRQWAKHQTYYNNWDMSIHAQVWKTEPVIFCNYLSFTWFCCWAFPHLQSSISLSSNLIPEIKTKQLAPFDEISF